MARRFAMIPSLERHLTRGLIRAIVVTALGAGSLSFYLSALDAQDFQDDTLEYIARLSLARPLAEARDLATEAGTSGLDPEERVTLVSLPAPPGAPAWLPSRPTEGFHDYDGRDDRWRVLVRWNGPHGIAVAQVTAARNHIALHSALDTLLPLLLLIPLLVLLAIQIVRRNLAQVQGLAQRIEARSAADLEPLSLEGIPHEIAPFLSAINGQLERIQTLMTQQQRFLADAAHELRSPLTAIALQLQNLENAAGVETRQERLDQLREGVERARHLTLQLLHHARSQVATPRWVPVDLSALARECIAEALALERGRDHDLGLECVEGSSAVSDPELLRLILRNGLDNALRHTPPGGEITLRIDAKPEALEIDLIDSGPGIPEAERERVFEPFYRVSGDPTPGTGLGLAIVHDAARRLGGTVAFKAREDGPGLILRFRRVPARPAAASAATPGHW